MRIRPFFEFSLCLSRACLGKMIIFIYKWRKRRFPYRLCSRPSPRTPAWYPQRRNRGQPPVLARKTNLKITRNSPLYTPSSDPKLSLGEAAAEETGEGFVFLLSSLTTAISLSSLTHSSGSTSPLPSSSHSSNALRSRLTSSSR